MWFHVRGFNTYVHILADMALYMWKNFYLFCEIYCLCVLSFRLVVVVVVFPYYIFKILLIFSYLLPLYAMCFYSITFVYCPRMDWFNLLAVQGTLRSLLQHHSSKAPILHHSAFFTVQLSHLHMTTGKTIALTRQIFVGKVMSLLFNMLSRLVITFLLRSKRLFFLIF